MKKEEVKLIKEEKRGLKLLKWREYYILSLPGNFLRYCINSRKKEFGYKGDKTYLTRYAANKAYEKAVEDMNKWMPVGG